MGDSLVTFLPHTYKIAQWADFGDIGISALLYLKFQYNFRFYLNRRKDTTKNAHTQVKLAIIFKKDR